MPFSLCLFSWPLRFSFGNWLNKGISFRTLFLFRYVSRMLVTLHIPRLLLNYQPNRNVLSIDRARPLLQRNLQTTVSCAFPAIA